jgi:hypothetical protein
VVDPELASDLADGPAAIQGELGGVAAELVGTSLVKLILGER